MCFFKSETLVAATQRAGPVARTNERPGPSSESKLARPYYGVTVVVYRTNRVPWGHCARSGWAEVGWWEVANVQQQRAHGWWAHPSLQLFCRTADCDEIGHELSIRLRTGTSTETRHVSISRLSRRHGHLPTLAASGRNEKDVSAGVGMVKIWDGGGAG